MAKTHQFTKNVDGKPVDIVLEKILSFEWDEHSECTSIKFVEGDKIGVSETVEEVRKVST